MFDSFYFKKGVLPDNKVGEEHEFQTKSLDCCLQKYTVHEDRTVTMTDLEGEPIFEILNCAIHVYSYKWMYDNEDDILNRKYLGSKYQEYMLTIRNNKLINAEKVDEEGYSE